MTILDLISHVFARTLEVNSAFPPASFFPGVGLRIRLRTTLGRFSIIYFSGLGLWIRVRVWVRVSV